MASSGNGQDQGYSDGFLECWIPYFGDHVHHGFYENPVVQLENASSALKVDDLCSLARDASLRLIDKLLVWANITDDDDRYMRAGKIKILDVGCGVGGVSRYLATTFGSGGASVQGITLEKGEVENANQITAAENLSDKVSFMVANALELPFPDNAYELVWCMECADHILDKQQLIKELVRVTTPGGRIVLTTMCCPEEAFLSESDKEMLRNLSDNMTAVPWATLSRYLGLAQAQGLEAIKSDNWTKYVIPGVQIWSHFYKEFASDCQHASEMGDFVKVLALLLNGYEQGLVHYSVFTAKKPSSSS